MQKINSNILVACVIVILINSSCNNNQFNSAAKQTPNSALSSMLLEPGDLSGNWKWMFSNVMQDPVTPSPNNNQTTERAVSGLSGSLFHEEKEYLFIIYHTVEYYDPSIPYVEPPFNEVVYSKPFSLHLMKVGDEMKFECSKDNRPSDSIFFCGILLKYKKIDSILRITGTANAGEPLIEEIINQILMAIDTRIKANQ